MLWTIIASISILILIIRIFYKRRYQYWKNMGVPQTSPLIIFGDNWPMIFRCKNLIEWLNGIYYMYPQSRFIGCYQFQMPVLMLRDPDLIKQMGVKDFDHFTDHNKFSVDENIDPIWGKNLFVRKGQNWRDMRSLLAGSFTSSKMRKMYGLIVEESEKFVNHFLKQNEDTLDLELTDAFTKYTNDVIASTSFGLEVDSLTNPANEFLLMGKEITNFNSIFTLIKFFGLQVCPWFFKLFKIGFISGRVRQFFCGIIEETIKAREEQGIVRPDMINLLLEVKNGVNKTQDNDVPDTGFAVVQESTEPGQPRPRRQLEITNEDIAAQALLFFSAGFGSVATTLCHLCNELAINIDIQEKLRKEIKEVFQKSKGKPTYEELLQMKYLDMVITETLRKWPVTSSADRVCVKPYTLLPSNAEEPAITFKKKDVIWFPIYNIHHDPQYYPNPEKFIPDRFSDENKGNIKPYTYMPFGVGPRACIGSRFALLEIKSVLVHLLYSFEIVPSEKTQIPLKFRKVPQLTFSPQGGFPLRLRRL